MIMTEEEIKIQLLLGTFPHGKITPDLIRNCQNINILKLIVRLWITLPITKSLNEFILIENDNITNDLISHPLMTPELRQYIIQERQLQKLKSALQIKKCYFNRYYPHITTQLYEEKLTKLINMEKELFGS